MLRIHPDGLIEDIEHYAAVLEPMRMPRSKLILVLADVVLKMQRGSTVELFSICGPVWVVYDPGETPFRPLDNFNDTLFTYLDAAGVTKEQVPYAFGVAYVLDATEFALSPWGADRVMIVDMETL